MSKMSLRIDGVILNLYPDSCAGDLKGLRKLLDHKDFRNLFSSLYLLPTLFQSDLDRGFSLQSYDLNRELADPEDLEDLREKGLALKLDFVLNHLSAQSPQFRDLVSRGEKSDYIDFFIDWNRFWDGKGKPDEKGLIHPDKKYLDLLFMRKPGLPVLEIPFPDGSTRYYWNTFYQQILPEEKGKPREYLGQMDLNAESEKVWQFYGETLDKLQSYGTRLVRLDAFAYLHKEAGKRNFFNEPGTWDQLDRLRDMAQKRGMSLLPEIHGTYTEGIHRKLNEKGYPFYDFFLPGLILYSLETSDGAPLFRWIQELIEKRYQTVNMLGCHDGIPLLDIQGLLDGDQIDQLMETVQSRGGRVKDLYGPDGKKISYYQVNATYFSALGEDEKKFLLARAIQLFAPGIPQVWYLDLFGGTNDYEAADQSGHKEINRTNLSWAGMMESLESSLVQKQLELIRIRKKHPAFKEGSSCSVAMPDPANIHIVWTRKSFSSELKVDLKSLEFSILCTD